MTVDARLSQESTDSPVQGAYVQPGPGIAMPGVVLFDADGVAITSLAGGGVAQGSTTSGQTGALVQGAVTTSAPSYTTAQTSPVSLTTAGSMRVVDNSTVAQASTTSGQTGGLVQGAVTTAAPTYTNAQTDPLSLTTAGSLRTVDNATVAQASTTSGQVGPIVQGAVTTGVPTYTTAQTDPLSLDTSGRLRVLAFQYANQTATVQSSATAAAPTAGTAVATLTTPAAGKYRLSGTVSVSGTTVATAESNNFNLKAGATTLLTNIPIAVNGITGAPGASPFGPVVVTLDGATSVTVNAVGNATASSIYAAQLIGELVG